MAADEQARTAAERQQDLATASREAAESAVAGLRSRIEQLKASSAYQAVEQMGDLERLVRTCLNTAAEASAVLARRQDATARGRSEAERATALLADLTAAVSRTAAEVAEHATRAGIPWHPADAAPDGGVALEVSAAPGGASLAERAGARVAVRMAAVRAVRAAIAEHHTAGQARDLARLALDRASQARDDAEQAEQAAAQAVERALSDAQQALGDWSRRHAGLLPAPQWQELTAALADALARFGEPDVPLPETVFTSLAAAAEQQVREEQAALRAQQTATSAERASVAAERDRIAAERDDAPPAHQGRTAADRADRAGAPLWRLVRFAGHIADDRAAAIEAALQATGMLDAWVTPSADGVSADDAFLVSGAPALGRQPRGRAGTGGRHRGIAQPSRGDPEIGSARRGPVLQRRRDRRRRPVLARHHRRPAPQGARRVHRRHRPCPPPRWPDRRLRGPDRSAVRAARRAGAAGRGAGRPAGRVG